MAEAFFFQMASESTPKRSWGYVATPANISLQMLHDNCPHIAGRCCSSMLAGWGIQGIACLWAAGRCQDPDSHILQKDLVNYVLQDLSMLPPLFRFQVFWETRAEKKKEERRKKKEKEKEKNVSPKDGRSRGLVCCLLPLFDIVPGLGSLLIDGFVNNAGIAPHSRCKEI